jgi:hypothetical protein
MSDAVYAGDLVHDGDTINVKLDVGFDLTVDARVRVFGINAPSRRPTPGRRPATSRRRCSRPATQ